MLEESGLIEPIVVGFGGTKDTGFNTAEAKKSDSAGIATDFTTSIFMFFFYKEVNQVNLTHLVFK